VRVLVRVLKKQAVYSGTTTRRRRRTTTKKKRTEQEVAHKEIRATSKEVESGRRGTTDWRGLRAGTSDCVTRDYAEYATTKYESSPMAPPRRRRRRTTW
jgi:hypothetical protein